MAFGWLRRLWGGRPTLPELRVTVYTRQGCHLCEVAWGQLRPWQRRYQFLLEAVDIDADPELHARFDQCVPVVAFDGKVRFRGRVNLALLKRQFEAELARVRRQARAAPGGRG